jgi:hypothetical protein
MIIRIENLCFYFFCIKKMGLDVSNVTNKTVLE